MHENLIYFQDGRIGIRFDVTGAYHGVGEHLIIRGENPKNCNSPFKRFTIWGQNIANGEWQEISDKVRGLPLYKEINQAVIAANLVFANKTNRRETLLLAVSNALKTVDKSVNSDYLLGVHIKNYLCQCGLYAPGAQGLEIRIFHILEKRKAENERYLSLAQQIAIPLAWQDVCVRESEPITYEPSLEGGNFKCFTA